MKKYSLLFLLLLIVTRGYADNGKINFDFDWQFHLGDMEEISNSSVSIPQEWKMQDVQLPHDWNTTTEFEKRAGQSTGYQPGGKAWYRKSFLAPTVWEGKDVSILFDGVYYNCDIYVNGQKLCSHFYGFTPFSIRIGKHLQYGKNNEILVRVNHEKNARWYTGSGINRHVWLRVVNPIHVKTYGTAITTPVIQQSMAQVNVVTSIENLSGVSTGIKVIQFVKDDKGKIVAKGDAATLQVNDKGEVSQSGAPY